MLVLTLSILKEIFTKTEEKATPHRTPDFKWIEEQVEGDPEIRGDMVFLEGYNTGYDGDLERWMFTTEDKKGEPVRFMADLLPGIVTSCSEEEVTEEDDE